MKAIVLPVIILLAAIGAEAQTLTTEQINQAVTTQRAFFDSKTNQTLSTCSDGAWSLIRYESELNLTGKKGPETTAQEVMDKRRIIDDCKSGATRGYNDLWNAVASMLKMQGHGGDFVSEIQKQLGYLETLSYIQTLAEGASEKIFRDYLYASHDQLQTRYDRLVTRYNALAESLASVPLPSSYQRPTQLHCATTSNHLGEWSTITTDCQ
jgi:hypothetical protein